MNSAFPQRRLGSGGWRMGSPWLRGRPAEEPVPAPRAGGTRRPAGLVLFAAALLSLSVAAALAEPIPIYSTGASAAVDGSDRHWTIVSSPYGDEHAAMVVTAALPGWYAPTTADATWVSYHASGGDTPLMGQYRYRTSFDLTGLDPSTAVLTGQWTSDNGSRIYLNGEATTFSIDDNSAGFLHDFTISRGFVSGTNHLDIEVDNIGEMNTGMIALVSGTATPVGEADLLIKHSNDPDTAYAGLDDLQTIPNGVQVLSQTVFLGEAQTCQVKVVNSAETTHSYVLKAVESLPGGWTIKYRASQDFSQAARSANGYTTPVLAPGQSMVVTLSVEATSVGAGSTCGVTLQAYASGTLTDSVRVNTSARDTTQADLLIKHSSERTSAYTSNDLYLSVPFGDQIRAQTMAVGGQTAFNLKVQNDGAVAKQFSLKAAATGTAALGITYRVGPADITHDITAAAGYRTPRLNPGASLVVTMTVVAGTGTKGGAHKTTDIAVRLPDSSVVLDAVRAIVNVPAIDSADLLIKKGSAPQSAYALNDVYQTKPAGAQIVTQSIRPGAYAAYQVNLQNDNNMGTTRALVLKAVEGAEPGWKLTYTLGSTDITEEITDSAGYLTGSLAPGAKLALTILARSTAAAAGGHTKTTVIRAYHGTSDVRVRDAVQASTFLEVVERPDLLVKRDSDGESAYAIGNIYLAVPSGKQVVSQMAPPEETAIYQVKVQNDGNTPHAFVVRASATGGVGWATAYLVDGTVVTPAITGAGGFVTPMLPAGDSVVVTVQLTPPAGALASAFRSATLKVFLSGTDATIRDAVKVVATVSAVGKPDLLIKRASEPLSALSLNNAYQVVPAGGQVCGQSVWPGARAAYTVQVQNDGNTPRSYVIKAVVGPESGGSVVIKAGGTDITQMVLSSAGYPTGTLSAGGGRYYTVEVTPGAAVPVGVSEVLTLRAFLDSHDATVRDAVQAVTTTAAGARTRSQ